jgi:predicted metalloprotease with PDZ domain
MRTLRIQFVLTGVAAVLLGTCANAAPTGSIAAPVDRPFHGNIKLEVDARDVERRVIHVRETITGLGPEAVLLYPKWLPGTHAPEGPIDRLAGLTISAGGKPVSWSRDTVEVYAFRLHIPAGNTEVEVNFDYLAPTSDSVGAPHVTRDLLIIEWNDVLLYPAGYFARQIPVAPDLAVPAGWKLASALEQTRAEGGRTVFGPVSLEKLMDSPVYAGRYAERIDLDAATGVSLDVFADRPDLLEASPEVIAAHRALVTQAYKLFNSHHYAHYDFLFALTDQIPGMGLEHHQSSEDSTDPNYFVDWAGTPGGRDLLAHEYTHSWNGKFRRPADLWTSSYEVPMQDSLLWVYEGQTEYWGMVLTARAGLWSKAQALDAWAEVAAYYSTLPGRRWRPLQDTTNDEIINPRRPQSWGSWQRFEDYYHEGALIWLEADTLIRERSAGKRSLDDFAARFFGVKDGSYTPMTYTFAAVVSALNAVEPYDWSAFLRQRLDAVGQSAPLAGLERGGYKLVYTAKQSDFQKDQEEQRKHLSLGYSAGLVIEDKDDTITSVAWDSPAFKAGLTEGMQILAVNGEGYSKDLLKRTLTAATHSSERIVLILKSADRYITANLDYHGGLRYPHLERVDAVPARFDEILSPRQ